MIDLLDILRKNKNYVIIGGIAVMVIITVLTIGKSVKNEKIDLSTPFQICKFSPAEKCCF